MDGVWGEVIRAVQQEGVKSAVQQEVTGFSASVHVSTGPRVGAAGSIGTCLELGLKLQQKALIVSGVQKGAVCWD